MTIRTGQARIANIRTVEYTFKFDPDANVNLIASSMSAILISEATCKMEK